MNVNTMINWFKTVVFLMWLRLELNEGVYFSFSILYENVKVKYHDENQKFPNKLVCAIKCRSRPGCTTFAYDNQSKDCYFYDHVLLGNEEKVNYPGLVTYVNNLALNKPTAASSKIQYDEGPERSVDGNMHWYRFQTSPEVFPWWCIDLQNIFHITKFVIYNRDESHPERMRNFHLRISAGGDCTEEKLHAAKLCYINNGSISGVYTVTGCNQPSSGFDKVRTVFINIFNDTLHFKQVMIFPKIFCNEH